MRSEHKAAMAESNIPKGYIPPVHRDRNFNVASCTTAARQSGTGPNISASNCQQILHAIRLIADGEKTATIKQLTGISEALLKETTDMLKKVIDLYKQPASKSNVPAILDMIATGLDETKIRLKLRVTDDEMEDALDLAARLIGRFAVANADKETVRKKTGSGQQTMTNRRKRLRAAAAGRRAK